MSGAVIAIVILIVLLLLIGLGVGLYFVFRSKNNNPGSGNGTGNGTIPSPVSTVPINRPVNPIGQTGPTGPTCPAGVNGPNLGDVPRGCAACSTRGIYLCPASVMNTASNGTINQNSQISCFRVPQFDPVTPPLLINGQRYFFREANNACPV